MSAIKRIDIVSLSSGVLGESFLDHERALGLRRLEAMGVEVRFAEHSLAGLDYLRAHPEARAQDLLDAFSGDADMILCAIGGDDTYRLLPYLFEHDELRRAARSKVFLGFSDTTINHLMLHKVGLPTFYGQSFLADVCELDRDMLPYTRHYLEELLATGTVREVRPSKVWYDGRTDFGVDQMGVAMPAHPDRGWELLRGAPRFGGKILGGCVDSLYDVFDGTRYADMPELCRRYGLLPRAEEWRGRILLLESSEEKPSPAKYRQALQFLVQYGIFDNVSGVLVGKPMDETYQEQYHEILLDAVPRKDLPVLANLNVGHATPRCILPFGVEATVDAEAQIIRFEG